MDRRTFLTRIPLGMAGGVASLLPGRQDKDPQRERIHQLLASAEQHYAQAQDLVHYPQRYDEVEPLLQAALEAAAEAWLLDRGVLAKTRPHYPWFYMARTRADTATGIPWREAHKALVLMQQDCKVMPAFCSRDDLRHERNRMLQRSRTKLVSALDTVASCIASTRRETRRG